MPRKTMIEAPPRLDTLSAVFPGKDRAETAIERLRFSGIPEDLIGVAMLARRERPEPGTPLGSLAGFPFVAARVPGGGAVGVAGMLAAPLGTEVASILGGRHGALMKVRLHKADDRWCRVQIMGNDVLVVVRAGRLCARAREALGGLDARIFPDGSEE